MDRFKLRNYTGACTVVVRGSSLIIRHRAVVGVLENCIAICLYKLALFVRRVCIVERRVADYRVARRFCYERISCRKFRDA